MPCRVRAAASSANGGERCSAAQDLRADQAQPPACSLASRLMDLNPSHPDHVADSTRRLLMTVHHWCYSFQLGAPTPWDSEMYILLTPHCDSLTYDDG